MYYIQKSQNGYYLSHVAEGALFSVETLPERPHYKAGHMFVLEIDEEQQKVWYECKKIEVEPTTEDRLSALESAMLAMIEG